MTLIQLVQSSIELTINKLGLSCAKLRLKNTCQLRLSLLLQLNFRFGVYWREQILLISNYFKLFGSSYIFSKRPSTVKKQTYNCQIATFQMLAPVGVIDLVLIYMPYVMLSIIKRMWTFQRNENCYTRNSKLFTSNFIFMIAIFIHLHICLVS